VLRPINNETKSFDLSENSVGRRGPQKGASLAVVLLHEAVDLDGEISHAGKRSPADGSTGNESKPALHLVEP